MNACNGSWRRSTCVETSDLFALFVRPLHRSGLRYMISGSLASIYYGEPRLTMDVDIVVHLDRATAELGLTAQWRVAQEGLA